MSTANTPTKSASLIKAKKVMAGCSSSQPDLPSLGAFELESKNMSLRKRKSPDNEFTHQFTQFKEEILGILKESSMAQIENMNTMGENITSSIREELKDIKSTTDLLVTENNNLKSQVANLTDTVNTNKEIITCLQNEIQKLKSEPRTHMTSMQHTLVPNNYDDFMLELQERTTRSKNIIIVGVDEQHSDNTEKRRELDRCEAERITTIIYPGCPKPEKIIRIGRYDEMKARPMKLCFDSQETVKIILRNKTGIKENSFRIYSDQTPYQQNFMVNLKKELKERQERGETDLTIKYIKGIPKIITQPSKN